MADRYEDRGKPLYSVWCREMQVEAARRGHQAGPPRWKDVKPWVKRVWNRTFDAVSA